MKYAWRLYLFQLLPLYACWGQDRAVWGANGWTWELQSANLCWKHELYLHVNPRLNSILHFQTQSTKHFLLVPKTQVFTVIWNMLKDMWHIYRHVFVLVFEMFTPMFPEKYWSHWKEWLSSWILEICLFFSLAKPPCKRNITKTETLILPVNVTQRNSKYFTTSKKTNPKQITQTKPKQETQTKEPKDTKQANNDLNYCCSDIKTKIQNP